MEGKLGRMRLLVILHNIKLMLLYSFCIVL